MVAGTCLAPISITPVYAYEGISYEQVEMPEDEEQIYEPEYEPIAEPEYEQAEMPNYEELEMPEDKPIVQPSEIESYIILPVHEPLIDVELLSLISELRENNLLERLRALAAILAAGGVYFTSAWDLLSAVMVLDANLDEATLGILNDHVNNVIYIDGSTRTMQFTAETLVPIWNQINNLLIHHEASNGRQMALIRTAPSINVPDFHVWNYIGESVIPVIYVNSIPFDNHFTDFRWILLRGTSDYSYVAALRNWNRFLEEAIFRGNTFATSLSFCPSFRSYRGDLYRNGIRVNFLHQPPNDVGTITHLGFVIIGYSTNPNGWPLNHAFLYTNPQNVTGLFFSPTQYAVDSWAEGFIQPYLFPAAENFILGRLATQNIVTNMAAAQTALLDAAGFVTASCPVMILLPDDVQDLVDASVVDVVIPRVEVVTPSYAATRILAAILAAGGISFSAIEYMELATVLLYNALDTANRDIVNYHANRVVYAADSVRATRWTTEALIPIWNMANNLFSGNVTDDGQRIERARTSVLGTLLHFHIGYYSGWPSLPIVSVDRIPNLNPYKNDLIDILPETVYFSGNTYSASIEICCCDCKYLFIYRNDVVVGFNVISLWQVSEGIISESGMAIAPIGFVMLKDANNLLRLAHVHYITHANGVNQVVLRRTNSTILNANFTPNFIPIRARDTITGNLSTANIITTMPNALTTFRRTAGVTSDTDYVMLQFPHIAYPLINATVTDVVIRDIGEVTRRTGTAWYASPFNNSHDHGATFVFDIEYFLASAYEYNPSLATMSLLFQLSSWNSHDFDCYTYKMLNAYHLLTELGFEGFAHNYTDFANHGIVGMPTKDSIGAVAAHRVINDGDYTLIALAIRGGFYGSEWASNFTIGSSGHHQGFNQSSYIVALLLWDYISRQGITGDIKLWLTGYSRAGAVANLLAGGINSGRIALPPQVTLGSHNFFTYTFATPAGVLRPSSIRFGNIFNIIHPSDPVPMVAPLYWNFERYGIDQEIPTRERVSHLQYRTQKDSMLQHFYTLESVLVNDASYTLDDFTRMMIHFDVVSLLPGIRPGEGNPLSIRENTRNPQIQSAFLRDFVTSVARDRIGTRNNYVDTLQDSMRTTAGLIWGTTPQQTDIFVETLVGRFTSVSGWAWIVWDLIHPLSGGTDAALDRILSYVSEALETAGIPYTLEELDHAARVLSRLLIETAVSNPNRTTTLIMNVESIGQAHYPEIYLAWLMAMDPNYMFGGSAFSFPSGFFRIVRINCPVDVRVYYNNELVAAIIDDVPQNISSIVASVNEDGEKLVFLPAAYEYNIVLTATGDSTMTFSVSEFNPHAGDVNRIVNYFDIPITTGQRFDAQISEFSIEDLQNTTTTASSTVYTLTVDHEIIQPDEDLTGYQAITAFYEVSAASADDTQGIVLGSGFRQRGAYAIVTAIPLYGYAFTGWYADNLTPISTDAEHRFRVMADVSLTARFIPIYTPIQAIEFHFDDTSIQVPVQVGQSVDPALIPIPATRYAQPGIPGQVFMGWYTRIFGLMHYVNNPNRAVAFNITRPVAQSTLTSPDGTLHLFGSWVQHGDVNGDGAIDTSDHSLLTMHIAMGAIGANIIRPVADVNVDGVINFLDLNSLRQFLAFPEFAILGPRSPEMSMVEMGIHRFADDGQIQMVDFAAQLSEYDLLTRLLFEFTSQIIWITMHAAADGVVNVSELASLKTFLQGMLDELEMQSEDTIADNDIDMSELTLLKSVLSDAVEELAMLTSIRTANGNVNLSDVAFLHRFIYGTTEPNMESGL